MTDNARKSVIDGGDVIKSNTHLTKLKGQIVYLKRLKKQKVKVDRKLLKEMKTVRKYLNEQFNYVLVSMILLNN